MSMTEQEQTKAAQIAVAVDKFILAKNGIRANLNTYGVACGDEVPFADYPGKVADLGRKTIPASNEAVVTVYLNPSGADYWLPEAQSEREALLAGAKAILKVDGVQDAYETALTKLEGEELTFRFTLPGSARAILTFSLGTAQALVAKQTVHAKGGSTATVTCTTYENAVAKRYAFGRAQIWNGQANNPNDTWTILREYEQDGTYTDHIGYYDDTDSSNPAFVSQTGIKLALKNGGDTAEDPVSEVVIENPDGTPLENKFKCLRDIRIVTVTCGVAQTFVRFPKCYTKREKTTITIEHRANGAHSYDETKTVIINWIADDPLDGFHLHGAFIRSVRGGADVELDQIFIGRYKVNASYNTVSGADSIGTTRANYCSNIKAKNGTQLIYTDEYGISHTYSANADVRRWAMIGYREQSLLILYALMWFGVDTQNGIHGSDGLRGICTTASPDPGQQKTGTTDHLVAKGIMIGGSDNNNERKPTIFLGIENPFSSQEGTMMSDVTSLAFRAGEGNTVPVNELLICLDRNDYNPGSDAKDALLAAGYHELQVEYPSETPGEWDSATAYAKGDLVTYRTRQFRAVAPNTNKPPVTSSNSIDTANWQPLAVYLADNTRQADLTAPIERDLYFPTQAKTDENITVASVDNHWANSVPSAGATTENWKSVAIGAHRSAGSSLGAFFLVASDALGNSAGATWRSRASLQLV